ncbi:hypothetical protein [Streptomyces sp. I8-5]
MINLGTNHGSIDPAPEPKYVPELAAGRASLVPGGTPAALPAPR